MITSRYTSLLDIFTIVLVQLHIQQVLIIVRFHIIFIHMRLFIFIEWAIFSSMLNHLLVQYIGFLPLKLQSLLHWQRRISLTNPNFLDIVLKIWLHCGVGSRGVYWLVELVHNELKLSHRDTMGKSIFY